MSAEFREQFLEIAKISRISASQCGTMVSVFPMIQDRLSKRLRSIPEDVPMFDPGIGISCLLGSPLNPHFDFVSAALILICVNTIHRVSSLLTQVSLTEDDLKMIQVLYGSFKALISGYRAIFGDLLNPLIQALEGLYKQLKQPKILQDILGYAQDVYNAVLQLYRPKVNLGPLVPVALNFLLDFHTLDLFEFAANNYSEIGRAHV
jgi:hypothetical protein